MFMLTSTLAGRAARRTAFALCTVTAALAASHVASSPGVEASAANSQQPPASPKARGGYVLERDSEVAREEPGTHKGGGTTIGYSFFKDTPNLAMISASARSSRDRDRLPRAEGRRDLLRAQRARADDDRRQGDGGRPGHRGADAARQLARTEAGRDRRPGDHDQLPAAATGALNPSSRLRRVGAPPASRNPAAPGRAGGWQFRRQTS